MDNKLPVRKRIRLQNYDYSEANMYFITICTKNKFKILGNITNDKIQLTKIGKAVKLNLSKIEELYDNLKIDEYVIMPNHIHILFLINYKNNITISRIIKHFKTNITREIKTAIWQKSFYEHIVRDEEYYKKIKDYINNNVINWKKDKYF